MAVADPAAGGVASTRCEGIGLAATFAGLVAATKGRWVRRDETRGDSESSASDVGGEVVEGDAADDGGAISGLAVVSFDVRGVSAFVFGRGGRSVGGDATAVWSAGAVAGSGGETETEAGGEAGAAFFFRTDRKEPDAGASLTAGVIAGSCA